MSKKISKKTLNPLLQSNNNLLNNINNNNDVGVIVNDINEENRNECEINCMELYLNTLGEISYFCLICKGRLDHNNVIEHLQDHFNVNPYKCHICNNKFTNFEEFLNHIKLHEINENNNICDNEKENINILKVKKESIKYGKNTNYAKKTSMKVNNFNNYICYYCKLEFSNPHTRLRHLINHIENPFKCTICEKSFTIQSNHTQHMLIHSAENQSEHTQHTIDHNVENQTDQMQYMLDHTIENQSHHTQHTLNLHIENQTDNSPHFVVDQKETKRQNDHHVQNNTNKIINVLWKCNICNNGFDIHDKFKEHILDHKNGILPVLLSNSVKTVQQRRKQKPKTKPVDEFSIEYHICDICGKRFSDIRSLNFHIVVHTRERNYECPICKKRFGHSNYIAAHIRTHTNERPFKCELCDRAFYVSGKLSNHMLRHNNIRRYECTYCQRKFFDLSQLRSHTRTHTGERPYQCDICKQYFRTSYCMKTHRILHTGEKPYNCDLCNKRFAQLAGWHGHIKICRRNFSKMNSLV